MFCDIRKRALCCPSGIFVCVQFQIVGEYDRARAANARQSFHFQKYPRDLPEAMRQVNKQHIKEFFWIWGPQTFGTTCRVPNLFSKNTPPYCTPTHICNY